MCGTGEKRFRDDVFITNKQRQFLGLCRRWYLDGTFKVCPDGFVQLYTINGFLKAVNRDVIQVPFVLILMSRRQKQDYVEVFEYVKTQLLTICVVEIVSDFEGAIFSAVKDCFSNVSHFGCSFHWKQAVLRKAKQCGFSNECVKPGKVREAIQNILCLPYLPAEKIADVFNFVENESPSNLNTLFEYVRRVWVSPTAL